VNRAQLKITIQGLTSGRWNRGVGLIIILYTESEGGMMFKIKRLAAVIIVILFLASCAGTNFVRPEPESLSLGKTTYQDIINQFGKPYQEGTKLKNENMIKTATYAYSSAGGMALYEGVTPARAMAFHFVDDLLIGYEFSSSYKEDHSDYDDSKISLIKKGETTRGEVVDLLGEPKGIYVFPLIKNREDEAMVYLYSQFKSFKIYQKLLIVSVNNDIVTDVDFTTSGKK
jgi:hypothetical protein